MITIPDRLNKARTYQDQALDAYVTQAEQQPSEPMLIYDEVVGKAPVQKTIAIQGHQDSYIVEVQTVTFIRFIGRVLPGRFVDLLV